MVILITYSGTYVILCKCCWIHILYSVIRDSILVFDNYCVILRKRSGLNEKHYFWAMCLVWKKKNNWKIISISTYTQFHEYTAHVSCKISKIGVSSVLILMPYYSDPTRLVLYTIIYLLLQLCSAGYRQTIK